MDATVFTEILDKSISGDKIYGGTIDKIVRLVADELYVQGPNGDDAEIYIDGINVNIGNFKRIAILRSRRISAFNESGASYLQVANKTNNIVAEITADFTGHGEYSLWDSSRTERRMRLAANLYSYLKGNLVIGSDTELDSAFNLQIDGDVFATRYKATDGVDTTNIYGYHVATPDVKIKSRSNKLLSAFYDDFVSHEGDSDGHSQVSQNESDITTLDGRLDTVEPIAAEALTHKSNNGSDHSFIDQDVKTTANPTFASVALTSGSSVSDFQESSGAVNVNWRFPAQGSPVGGNVDIRWTKLNKVVTLTIDSISINGATTAGAGYVYVEMPAEISGSANNAGNQYLAVPHANFNGSAAPVAYKPPGSSHVDYLLISNSITATINITGTDTITFYRTTITWRID